MVNITLNKLQELYEFDDYLWLEQTIKLLKAKDLDNLDWDNLIEELESLGRNNFNKVRSLLRQIIIHILLLQYWEKEYDRNYRHWRGEIIAFRDDLNNSLTKTLRNKLCDELDRTYHISLKLVIEKTGLSPELFPDNCPYSLEQLLDDNWYPEK
ncbi:DUF29 domain-containing protein [Anabaena aphanizomenioides LEGE 00250]|uniref:DUF29 domain-containing protein n=1 Tax=Sphaerospermopsis aphanizomenoides LEGE 00250 TaxID=2777972 RepID=A0ABR9VBV1_9CYAN|nr:DUF29 domain-containing protein [Sphaerospermopsis aphanizomenoides]MBE9235966.1 DUF29 domain-containing protein [Sphaerospermopsis aphanizomenoides LEGE 00250]